MDISMCITVFLVLISCSPYSNREFASCAEYSVKRVSGAEMPVAVSLPESWEPEIIKNLDSVYVMATDVDFLSENGTLRMAGFLQYPSRSGYRKHLPSILRTLNPGTATLMSENGLLRIDGVALEYVIGNDALYSTFLIAWESPGESTTVLLLGRIDRKDDPTLSDFCFLGPVLEEFVRVHFKPSS